MTPIGIENDLRRVGRTLRGWETSRRLQFWAALVAVTLCVAGLADYGLQFTRFGRLLAAALVAAVAGAGLWRFRAAAARRFTVEGVAAEVERAFPALDNHLINYLQFAEAHDQDPFKQAYVSQGVPQWSVVRVDEMKNRKLHQRVLLGCLAALLLLAAPFAFLQAKWFVCLGRVVNPFSNVMPVCATHILAVQPGDTRIVQGTDLPVKCVVSGRATHRVHLDVKSADGTRSTYDLGRVGQAPDGAVRHRLNKIATATQYRFRAGDAPNPRWYTIETKPPLAFTTVSVVVTPPAYTRLKPRTFDALSESLDIPEGSQLDATVSCNFPLSNATARAGTEPPVTLQRAGTERTYAGALAFRKGAAFIVHATAYDGDTAECAINARLLPDAPPVIQITSPAARTVLAPNGIPAIQFAVADDYGLATVTVERASIGDAKESSRATLQSWTPANPREFTQSWKDETPRPRDAGTLAFYVVARDNCPLGPRVTRSKPILFDSVSLAKASNMQANEHAKADSTIQTLIEMQRANLEATKGLRDTLDSEAPWKSAGGQQVAIRNLTDTLLQTAKRALGGLGPTLEQLRREEMTRVIALLEQGPAAAASARPPLAEAAVACEETILRKLTYASAAVDQTQRQRAAAGLVALLKALIKTQSTLLASTQAFVKQNTPGSAGLVDQQDRLAGDVSEFVAACRREAPTLETSDPAFAKLVLQVADLCDARGVRQDMLKAAELLETNSAAQAAPFQEKALKTLAELDEMLNRAATASAEERLAEMREALKDASDRMQKIRELETKLLDAMKLTEIQKDRSDQEEDLLESEIAEMKAKLKEALLQIPRDLQIYPELSVANELIEDVYQVFEEVHQAEGSEAMTGDSAQEIGVLKPDELIEGMKKAEGRMDDMEMWLGDKPDAVKWNAEAFDKEEQPMMALGALPAAAEDLIGDLLKESESLNQETDDSAVNLSVPDFAPGWEVAEGPMASYGAQGKSGNQRPDHKEQSGRSIVGREGQAIGETAAGSGTIGEGDKNIENRITPEPLQSGQVQADGEAHENATGGGKQASGNADEKGMAGAGSNRRMDAAAPGSVEGLESLLAKTQAAHVKASLMNLRTDSLSEAAHHMRQASDAISHGLPILEVREYQRRAVASLKRAKTELDSGVVTSIDEGPAPAAPLEDATDEGNDEAPPTYRDLVAEYFKSLSESF